MKKFYVSFVLVMSSAIFLQTAARAESYVEALHAARSNDQIIEALYQLSYYGNKSCFWDYVKYLNFTAGEDEGSSAPQIRKAAAEALGRSKDDRGVQYLVERFGKEKNDSVKASIVFGLSFHQSPEVLPVVQSGLSSVSEELRYQSIVSAVRIAAKDTIPALKKILSTDTDDMRIAAAWALYSLGDDAETNKKMLIAGLRSPEPVIRFRSADFIGRAGIEDASGELVKALEIENRWWVKAELDRSLNLIYEVKRKKRDAEEDKAWSSIEGSSPAAEKKENVSPSAASVDKK
jgi:HEAT repeat protein